MNKRELQKRTSSIIYDAHSSTSIQEEVACLLRKLDASQRLNKVLYKAVMVGEEQLSGQILVEYIVSDIKQMRTAMTKAKKAGITCSR